MAQTRKKAPIADWETRKKLVLFIKALKISGRIDLACKASQAARGWVYEWRDKDTDFADNWTAAKTVGKEILKDEAFRRAHDGVDEPRFHQGELCGYVRKYSDTLLMFLIKQADPTYREHFQIDHGNAGSRPFIFQMLLHPDATAAAKEAATQ